MCQVLSQSWGRQEQDQLLPRAAQLGSMDSTWKSCFREDRTPEPEPKGRRSRDQGCRHEPWAGCSRRSPRHPQTLRLGSGNYSSDRTSWAWPKAGERTDRWFLSWENMQIWRERKETNIMEVNLKPTLGVPQSPRSGDLLPCVKFHGSDTTTLDVTLGVGSHSDLGWCYGLKRVPLKLTC